MPPQHSWGWDLAWLYPRCKKDRRINSQLLPRVPTSPAATDGDSRAPKSSRFHLSHLPIKCTVSSTTSQQPKNLLPSPRASGATWGGSGELSLRRQPPPGALAGPGHGFGGVFLVEPCLVWFPTCPCMWLSIASGPPQRSLRVGCSFYGYCSARGRAVGWMLGLAGPASPSGSARKLDREPVRAGAPEQDKEGRESKEGKLGSCRVPGVAPNRFASEQASERDGKGGETKKKKKKDDEKIAVLVRA